MKFTVTAKHATDAMQNAVFYVQAETAADAARIARQQFLEKYSTKALDVFTFQTPRRLAEATDAAVSHAERQAGA